MTLLMDTRSSITNQSLGKIVQRAPAVGAKMWCLFVRVRVRFVFTSRIAAQRQTAGIVITHRGDSLHRFRSNFAGPTGTWVRLAM